MRLILSLIFLIFLSGISLPAKAQQVNTLYFMEDIPIRHFLNPSFQPTTDFYVSLPVIGFTQFGVGNNSISLKDVIYNVNGKRITFLDSLGNIPRFYNTIKSNLVVRTDFQTTLLSVGFRNKSSYWTFSLSEKINGAVILPKDVFYISLFGTTNALNNSFNFKTLQSDISAYTEAAFGFSNQFDDKLTIGGKLKLLIGSANLSNTNNLFKLNTGNEKWTLMGEGAANYSGPVQINELNNYKSFTYTLPTTVSGWLKPAGIGAGIDLGCEYRINNRIKLSGAITDLGFIRWSRNTQNYLYGVNYTFDGVKTFENNTTISTLEDVYKKFILGNGLIDSMVTAFNSSKTSKLQSTTYTTATTAKVNLGFEYSLNDKMSLGILSNSQLFKNVMTEELTGSVNTRPFKWLNASLSYSVFNGRMSTLGAGLGLKTGLFHWFIAADYIPLEKASLSLSDLGVKDPDINIHIPYDSKCFNVSVGMNIVFNKKIKTDRGLVRSKKRNECNCELK